MKSNNFTAVDNHELALARRGNDAEVPMSVVLKQPSFGKAVSLCVQVSGLDDKEVYLSLGIDAGHWTRIMKGDAHFPLNQLNDLMNLCGNETPLKWLAHSRGYSLTLLKSEAERRADDAERRANEAEARLRYVTELMQGKVIS
jgi:hypothetical protein